MTEEKSYFQNPDMPDKLFEIMQVDKGTGKVKVRDDAGTEYTLKLDLLKLLRWRIVKKETQ
jgi:hypothetical protein